jgi:hypothetical protein
MLLPSIFSVDLDDPDTFLPRARTVATDEISAESICTYKVLSRQGLYTS